MVQASEVSGERLGQHIYGEEQMLPTMPADPAKFTLSLVEGVSCAAVISLVVWIEVILQGSTCFLNVYLT